MNKIILRVLILALIVIGCQENKRPTTDSAKISNFDLKNDYSDFKTKMTEMDTIKIFFDHSVCTYQGYEKIEITKNMDLLNINSKFKEMYKEDWKLVYEQKIAVTDTLWKFGNFIDRNMSKLNNENKNRNIATISNGTDTIKLQTSNLVSLNKILADYYLTMRELHPENKNNIYGYDIIHPE